MSTDQVKQFFCALSRLTYGLEQNDIGGSFAVKVDRKGTERFTTHIRTGSDMWKREPVEKVFESFARELLASGHGGDCVSVELTLADGSKWHIATVTASGEETESPDDVVMTHSVPRYRTRDRFELVAMGSFGFNVAHGDI